MSLVDSPEASAHRVQQGKGGYVPGFLEGPVVGSEGPGQCHLAQGDTEVHHPEQHEEIVDLQVDRVPGGRTIQGLHQLYTLYAVSKFGLCRSNINNLEK